MQVAMGDKYLTIFYANHLYKTQNVVHYVKEMEITLHCNNPSSLLIN